MTSQSNKPKSKEWAQNLMQCSSKILPLFSPNNFWATKQKNEAEEVNNTWVGRMAVSRAERRWSKEPRIETTLSVIVWLLCRDSLIRVAFSVSGSTPVTAIPIFFSYRLRFFLLYTVTTEKMRTHVVGYGVPVLLYENLEVATKVNDGPQRQFWHSVGFDRHFYISLLPLTGCHFCVPMFYIGEQRTFSVQ